MIAYTFCIFARFLAGSTPKQTTKTYNKQFARLHNHFPLLTLVSQLPDICSVSRFGRSTGNCHLVGWSTYPFVIAGQSVSQLLVCLYLCLSVGRSVCLFGCLFLLSCVSLIRSQSVICLVVSYCLSVRRQWNKFQMLCYIIM